MEFVDEYFTPNNPWIQTFVETGAAKELTTDLIRQLIKRIEIYPDKSVKVLFRYTDYMMSLRNYIEDCRRTAKEATGNETIQHIIQTGQIKT